MPASRAIDCKYNRTLAVGTRLRYTIRQRGHLIGSIAIDMAKLRELA